MTLQPSELTWLRELFQDREGPLLRYAERMTGDLERARDAVQEAFLHLCSLDPSKLESARESGDIVGWLYTVCRHRIIDYQRKERRMCMIDPVDVDTRPVDAESPSQQLERHQNLHHVVRIIETLPSQQQEVVVLKFQNGLSYKQIAQIMELSVSHVGVLLHTAMKAIREQMVQLEAVPSRRRMS